MSQPATPEFAPLFKSLVDRLCEGEGILRQDLADELGVHLHSVSSSAYRGSVSFELIERVAKRAKASPEELLALELAWLRHHRDRRGLKRDNVSRAVEIVQALLDQLDEVEDWLAKNGHLEEFLEDRKPSPLLRRARIRLREIGGS